MESFINEAGTLAGGITAILALGALLVKPIRQAVERRKQEKQDAMEFRQLVLLKLDSITDDIADLQYERLSQAHDFYMSQGWCPTSKKNQLCQMYRSYTGKGRNHLSAYYEQEILGLADRPPVKEE